MQYTSRLRSAVIGLTLALAPLPSLGQPARPATPARPAPAAQPPAAQSQRIEFKCPKEGSVTEIESQGQVRETTNLGPMPDDPVKCRWKRGFSTGGNLFGFWGFETADIRRGMTELFAGAAEVSFKYQGGGSGGGQWTYEDTWRRMGTETVTIAGAPVVAHVFQRTNHNQTMGGKWVFRLLFDPASGEWVKRTLVEGVSQNTPDFVARKLPAP